MQVFKVTKNLVKERIGAVFSYETEARAWCINNEVDYNRIEIVILHAATNDGSCILEYKSNENIDNPSSRYKRLCTLGWQCWDAEAKEWYLEEEVTPETTPEYLYFNEKGINIIRGSSHMFYYYNGIVYEHTPQARDYLLSLKAANGCNAVYKLEYFPPIETNSDYFLCTKKKKVQVLLNV